ncbi:glycosyltransferase involved in cell wall biosynthesis [Aquabacterium commune]|uniref:Glycosyltransferase involved in cell wall biosynthesis n=1 Tax=Aquabacterium commune TaxID=70586 RepID=A0A4R6R7W7_9BURK|nr:glycosyltransferase [Aquabacterium commune]TDP82101.1 glycosyltransferase involved in cell wall biosynthesis [Aquabacterium commune]
MTPPAPDAAPRPLRIVHVVDSLEVGGLERVTVDLAQAQAALGHSVRVFSIAATEGLKQELLDAGIPVTEGHKRRSLDWHTLSLLRACVRDARADVVHAHNFVPNYHAALATIGLGVAQVCTLHDMGARLQNRRLKTLFQLSLTRTRCVAMVGAQVHQRHLATGLVPADKAHTVLNGIPVARFASDGTNRPAARQQLGLNDTALVIGCVGRLVPLKNHHRMVDVMPALLQQHPHLRLVIVGDGVQAEALRQQVAAKGLQEHVVLAGQRSHVSALLGAFDVFALPSQTEGLSIALLEACATGLAVVATRVGGNPEIIVDDQTGLLVAPDDNDALAGALSRLLADSALRARLGAAAAQWVRAHASSEALAQAYGRVYDAALIKR